MAHGIEITPPLVSTSNVMNMILKQIRSEILNTSSGNILQGKCNPYPAFNTLCPHQVTAVPSERTCFLLGCEAPSSAGVPGTAQPSRDVH